MMSSGTTRAPICARTRIRVVMMVCGFLPGPYRMQAYRSVGHVRLTNKTPAATYRAPGRFESTFIRERLVDAVASHLGIDPIEVRRRNAVTRTRCRTTAR